MLFASRLKLVLLCIGVTPQRQLQSAKILPALALTAGEMSAFVGVPVRNPTPRRTVGLMVRRGGYQDAATRALTALCRVHIEQTMDALPTVP